jgi:hypothetical protein
MHASTNSFSRCTVRKTNCALDPDSRILRTASIPFKIGMLISVIMTSGQRLRASFTNVSSAAVPTTSKWADRSASSASNRLRGHRLIEPAGESRFTPAGVCLKLPSYLYFSTGSHEPASSGLRQARVLGGLFQDFTFSISTSISHRQYSWICQKYQSSFFVLAKAFPRFGYL